MSSEREEHVGFTEEEEVSWIQYFADFKTTVWPLLAAQGFTFPQALMYWRQEVLIGHICQLKEIMEHGKEEGL